MKRTKNIKLSRQVRAKVSKKPEKKQEYDGDTTEMISTGSTLLDLAISGGRIRGGGIPAGILVEIFGPSESGKTVLLCEIAGAIQRQKGEVMFNDPEARLVKQFAHMFDLDTDKMDYGTPDTVPEIFDAVRKWKPKKGMIHGIFTDSLAALSTDMEMGEKGDKMGARRAKEFSEGLRKICRILTKNKYLMVCSNQIRQTFNTFGPKYKSPGGEAIPFYSSLRLNTKVLKKIVVTKTVEGNEVSRITAIKINVDVFGSSVWKPYRSAPVTRISDYGVDDVKENLQFVKDFTKPIVEKKEQQTKGKGKEKKSFYSLNGEKLGVSMNKAIQIIEEKGLEKELKEQVIDLWETIESKFETERKPKIR